MRSSRCIEEDPSVVPADELFGSALALAGRIARNPQAAVRMTKRLMLWVRLAHVNCSAHID
jgi:enoyl-CoA hydratase/carnithine racemase